MNQFICPKGHVSSESDYCSECGAKMQAAEAAGQKASSSGASSGSSPAGAATSAEPDNCPDCGTPRDPEIAFCEICGYNFVTGAHGDLSAIPLPVAQPVAPPEPDMPGPEPEQAAPRWMASLGVDPALQEPGSPAPPEGVGPFTFPLTLPVSLVGRRSEARGIFPEIPVGHDDAVSHRHALLQLDPAGALAVRDIGSSNGTRLNGVELKPAVDYPLKDGDVVSFGHWSTITVTAS